MITDPANLAAVKSCIIKQTQPTVPTWLSFPNPPFSTFREIVCLPFFGCLIVSCVWSYPPQHHYSYPPICIQPRCCTRRQHFFTSNHVIFQTPNQSPLLSPPPFTTIHASIWCRGRWLSTGPRAACSLNGIPSGTCSVYATTQSGLS